MRNRIWSGLLAMRLACAAVATPLGERRRAGPRPERGADEDAVSRQQDNPARGRGNPRVYQDAASPKGYESG